jgi:hypothetical protein
LSTTAAVYWASWTATTDIAMPVAMLDQRRV